ncbi:seryl-tRNA synthetase [Mycoemilia scoparia]|uniref:serine--tRNA ligase n=1 Tax=Mycoemilia scoparia TaxID=417184 RepID=A0A9W8DQA0_9FUNG|nr:seryl-tRNA synthetase [Mycoemilia scoparia]
MAIRALICRQNLRLYIKHHHQQIYLYAAKYEYSSKSSNGNATNSMPPNQYRGVYNYKYIRDNADQILQNAKNRNVHDADPHIVGQLYEQFRTATTKLNELRSQLNQVSKRFGKMMAAANKKGSKMKPADQTSQDKQLEDNNDDSGGETKESLAKKANDLKDQIKDLKSELQSIEDNMVHEASKIPNSTHPDVPIGDESAAKVVQEYHQAATNLHSQNNNAFINTSGSGSSKPSYLDHVDIYQSLGIANTESASKVAGSRFHYLVGAGALLEQALVQFSLQKAMAKGYVPYVVPDMARADIIAACGFRPRAATTNINNGDGITPTAEPSQIYQVSPVEPEPQLQTKEYQTTNPLCLVATAEIPLVAFHADKVFNTPPSTTYSNNNDSTMLDSMITATDMPWHPTHHLQQSSNNSLSLPTRMVGVSHCFRAEAGAGGKDTRGLYRLHQFTKVEMVVISTPDQSNYILEEIRGIQESIFQDLGLNYRVLDMPTHELGAAAYRKYDIEAWMPGRGKWGEISSASNCTDFQARRLNIRYKSGKKDGGGLDFVHTLNGTACAVPRTLVALLETHYNEKEKCLYIPKVLRPWMMGVESLKVPHTSTSGSNS